MKPRLATLLVVTVMIVGALAPLALAQGRSDDRPDRADDRSRAGHARTVGNLQYENGSASGAFVAFDYDEADGTVSGWSYENRTIITEISWENFTDAEVRAQGAAFHAWEQMTRTDTTPESQSANAQHGNNSQADDQNQSRDPDERSDGNASDDRGADGNETADDQDDAAARDRARLHDNPPGVIKLDVHEPQNVTWTFASDLNVTAVGNHTVEIAGDGFAALLWRDRADNASALAVDGQTVTVEVADQAAVLFRVSHGPDADEDAAERGREIARAASEGHVGAEIAVGRPDDAGQTPTDVAAYDDINASSKAQQGRADVTLDFEGDAKTIVINVDRGVVNASSAADVAVRFDNRSIPAADDLADVLDPTDDEAPAEYLVTAGSSGVEVIVSVSGWSPHTVSIEEAGSAEMPTTPGFGTAILMLALVVSVGAIAMKRR